MKRIIYFLFAFLLISGVSAFAKNIVVAEHTLAIPSDSTVTLYYGFASGDKVRMDLAMEHQLNLSSVEIAEYPTAPFYSEVNTQKVKNKSFVVTRTGIYKFTFCNKAVDNRVCRLKIERTPAGAETEHFSSAVYWRTVLDTTYTPVEEKYTVKSDTLVQQIYAANPQVPARSALGSNNYQIIEFTLPTNTVSWSFYIGTGEQGRKNYERTVGHYTDRLASIVSRIPEYGPLAALALTGVSYFSNAQGDDNIQYWFLKDATDVSLFQQDKKFRYYKRGDVVSEASQMRSPLTGKILLAVKNDNYVDAVKLTIRVAAVEVNQKTASRFIQQMKVTQHKEPYLKN